MGRRQAIFNRKTVAKRLKMAAIRAMRDKGYSNILISEKTGIPESTVRLLLGP